MPPKLIGQVERTGSTGHGVSNDIQFSATFDGQPSGDDIAAAQEHAGYSCAGYGSPRKVNTWKSAEDRYTATWFCWASCD